MLPENTKRFFKLLVDKFKPDIEASGDLQKSFEYVTEHHSYIFFDHIHNEKEREELGMYLGWLFNKLILILINDTLQIVSSHNIDTQKKIALYAYKKDRWWFNMLIATYSSLLEQAVKWEQDKATDLHIDLVPSQENRSLHDVVLDFPRISIWNSAQLENLINCCISVLTYSIPFYCNLKKELGRRTRNAVMQVFCQKSLQSKTLSLKFFTKYLETLESFEDSDTQFFLSIMQTLAAIFKNIPYWLPDTDKKTSLELFKKRFYQLLQFSPVKSMNFENQYNIKRLVKLSSEILHHQMKNCTESWYFNNISHGMADMLTSVLDNFTFTEDSVQDMRILVPFNHSAVIMLMKYVVIAEAKATQKFDQNLASISPTWREIHKLLEERVEKLSQKTSQQLLYQTSDCLILAVQIEFMFTQYHQMHHGFQVGPTGTCFCMSIDTSKNQDSLMHFSHWDYKHINLIMFENLESITSKLLIALDKQELIDPGVVMCYIDISACLLKFSINTKIVESLRKVLMAIVASPFYKPFKEHPKFSKLAGFQQILSMLPVKFKTFFEISQPHLLKVQIDSLANISQLELNRLMVSCWWLVENIMQFISTGTNVELKTALSQNFTNFIVNNTKMLPSCIEIYQKLVADLAEPTASVFMNQLNSVLCLINGNVLIIKLKNTDNMTNHLIICDDCELESTVYKKGSSENDVHRVVASMKDTNGVLVSADYFKLEPKSLHIGFKEFFNQPEELRLNLLDKIPAIINHSQEFSLWIARDKGKTFFEKIFIKNEKALGLLHLNLKDILTNILKLPLSDEEKKAILGNCFVELTKIAQYNPQESNKNLQTLAVNMAFTFGTTVNDENSVVKCLKIFFVFIIQTTSHIMGEASLLALEMIKRHNTTLGQLFKWHRHFIMQHVVHLVVGNFFAFKTPLTLSLVNFLKRLNLPRTREFVPPMLDIIIAIVLPMAMTSPKLLASLSDLCNIALESLKEAIEKHFLKIYQSICTTSSNEKVEKCEKYIESVTEKTIRDLLTFRKKKTVEEVLVYYNKSPDFVIQVLNIVVENDSMVETDDIADDISSRFLGVLIYFEPFITSPDCERVIKKNILLSLGDIIRLLGTDRVTKFCFKIISVLKAAMEQTSVDLSAICMQIWRILIRICDVPSLGSNLSTIFVSLEEFIEKYPDEVHELYSYLVVENRNLLSRNISDLFFIEKTKVSDDIKRVVLRQMESQRLRDEANFKSSLTALVRSLNNENSDLKIRVYCLQYLKELFAKNRTELNELICGQMTMDPLIEELLHIIINNCKSTSNEELLLATAECLGELGAIEPSLQKQNYASLAEFPKTIHSDEFAKMALQKLCRSYQYKNDSKYIDALSLAIQQVLKSRNVTSAGDHEVWLAIPEKMRPLMEPLLSSSYSPRQGPSIDEGPIFWKLAQTLSNWVFRWSEVLIQKINDEDTKYFLECLKPSMRHNHQTTSMFLPYILLHNLEMSEPTTHGLIIEEMQSVFDIVLGKDCFETEHIKVRKPLYVKDFDFVPITQKSKSNDSTMKSEAIKVAKLVFEMFDFLENHRRTYSTELTCHSIGNLLDSFDLKEMAEVNYLCGEYARALIYIERKMKTLDSEHFQEQLPFLANIYVKLGNIDAVEGIQTLKSTEWSLEEKVMLGNVIGNHQDAAVCFERLQQCGGVKLRHIESMVSSYVSLSQPKTSLLVYENMMQKLANNQENQVCNEIKAEPLWRMSRFDELQDLFRDKEIEKSHNWGVRCGQLLLKSGTGEKFYEELRHTRLAMMKKLKISGNEQTAYGKNYREILNIHLISNFEKVETTINQLKQAKSDSEMLQALEHLFKEWNLRMEFVPKNVALEEPIYCLHRVMLGRIQANLLNHEFAGEYSKRIDNEIGNLWIKSIKLALKNKMYQQAQMFVLNAEPYQSKSLFLEKAKLHWIKNDQNNAFKILELGTQKLLDGKTLETLEKGEKMIYSQAKLMFARYNAEAINVDFETNKKYFCEATVKGAENEKVFLAAAEYMDRFYCKDSDKKISRIGKPRQMINVMNFYYKSMVYGNEYVFLSMPRFLSIWLDSAAVCDRKDAKDIQDMNRAVEKIARQLDAYYFYTAFSQLMSRICHPSEEVFEILKSILVKLFQKYTQQSLWFLVPMLKSIHTQRAQKCKKILSDARIMDTKSQVLVNEFRKLIEKFVRLAKHPLETPVSKISIASIVPDLKQLLESRKTEFVMPFQCNLQLIRVCKQNTFKFPDKMVNIYKIQDEADVMRSLQKPRKVTLIGDDGKKYAMLFKTNDDLRIDLRFMEFSSVLKEFLHKDPESRHRHLTTRTYSVIPLAETEGLIEWVPNLRTYKEIINIEYVKKKYRPPSMHDIIKKHIEKMKPADQIREYRQLKNLYYPVLGDYFRRQFPTPQNFYNARDSFIRTTAVISIIGYILGLGDRHCENILFDELSGETFHVDFNMLFNKGEKLGVPETVPFRLTHQMIDAMGVLGIEGSFRKSCEIVLKVLQKEKSTLLSYLRPLVYDPLLKKHDNWMNDGSRGENEHVEKEALLAIIKIEDRLNGIVSKYGGTSSIPLSTEGQVRFIIDEATNEQNLSAMFHGWAPWI